MYIQVSYNKTLTGLDTTKPTEKLHNTAEAASLPSSWPYISSTMYSKSCLAGARHAKIKNETGNFKHPMPDRFYLVDIPSGVCVAPRRIQAAILPQQPVNQI
jgi:hypothetical protein